MKIQFFAKGQRIEVDSDTFLDRFHKAPMEYVCRTGRKATHLVLGETEWAQFNGYVQAMKALGLTRRTPTTDALGTTPTPSFCGLTLLRSAEESVVMAVELETRKLTKEALAFATALQAVPRDDHQPGSPGGAGTP